MPTALGGHGFRVDFEFTCPPRAVGMAPERSHLRFEHQSHEFGDGIGPELGEDCLAADFDGTDADVELVGDGFVGFAGDDEVEHIAFGRCQTGEFFVDRQPSKVRLVVGAINGERFADGVPQLQVFARLFDQRDGAIFNCAHGDRSVGVGSEHHRRDAVPAANQLFLQFEPAHPQQAHVGHEAGRAGAVVRIEERFGRLVRRASTFISLTKEVTASREAVSSSTINTTSGCSW